MKHKERKTPLSRIQSLLSLRIDFSCCFYCYYTQKGGMSQGAANKHRLIYSRQGYLYHRHTKKYKSFFFSSTSSHLLPLSLLLLPLPDAGKEHAELDVEPRLERAQHEADDHHEEEQVAQL